MPTSGTIEGLPYMAIGNDELGDDLPSTIKCPNCKKKHVVKHSCGLDYVNCTADGNSYIVGMKGRSIANP